MSAERTIYEEIQLDLYDVSVGEGDGLDLAGSVVLVAPHWSLIFAITQARQDSIFMFDSLEAVLTMCDSVRWLDSDGHKSMDEELMHDLAANLFGNAWLVMDWTISIALSRNRMTVRMRQ